MALELAPDMSSIPMSPPNMSDPSEVIEMVLATTDTLSPIPPVLKGGVIAIAILGLLSFLSCTTLFLYITYRIFKPQWQRTKTEPPAEVDRRHEEFVADLTLTASNRKLNTEMKKTAETRWHPSPQACEAEREVVERPPSNPFLTLIHNLLIADIIQSFGMVLDVVWWASDGIFVATSTCVAQAFFINLGALSVSVFLIGIALNTYLTIVWGVKLSRLAVRSMVIFNWVFSFTLAFVGLGYSNSRQAGDEIFYARSVALCWINHPYATSYGLWLQNFWLVASMGVTVACYAWIAVALARHKRSSREMPQRAGQPPRSSRDRERDMGDNHGHDHGGHGAGAGRPGGLREPSGHHPAFLVYPVVYLLSSGPITVVGLVSSAGVRINLTWFLLVTALCSLAGLLDAILWSTTIVFSSSDDLKATGLENYDFMRTPSRIYGNMVWVEGAARHRPGSRAESINDRKWWRLNGGEDSPSSTGPQARPIDDNAILMDTVTSVTVDIVEAGRNTTSTSDYSPSGST